MKDLYFRLSALAGRTTALALCALWLPAWLTQVAATFLNGRPPGRLPALPLWPVVRGDLALIGPCVGDDVRGHKPGLVSPGALRRRMGIAHVDQGGGDADFFATASLKERVGLLLRYLWACALSGDRVAGDGETRLFGVRIDALSMQEAVGRIVGACDAGGDRPMQLAAFVNPDCLNTAYRDRDYHYLLQQADLVLPDGSGLRIAGKLLGLPLRDNVNGTDMFPLLCEKAAQTGKKLFLFGGRPGVAFEAAERMRDAYPALDIVGCLDGYSHSEDPDAVVRAINTSGADIVLVGLGAPRQERWLYEHRERLDAAIGIGVGGLFDYYSGRIERAPLWLREAGLEWVWRILQEPRAKWRRYVVGNPLFLARVMRERRLRRRVPGQTGAPDVLPSPAEWAAANAARGMTEVSPGSAARLNWRLGVVARRVAKRTLDVVVAAGALLALSPLLIATAALIRLESPGPVLFRQRRVGRRGREFDMLKFRSMYVDAEARLADLESRNESAGGVLFKIKDDPRVTRVGRMIRRLSIDELPQIINVLRGEMSIVGPRPALPSEVDKYSSADRKRLQANPGLTCLWQIGGRSDLSFTQQIALDIAYLTQQNVLKDIGIIAKTVPAVVNGKGAY